MAIKDWNGFKKSGDTYIPNDATARAGVSATVDLLKDTTGWIGGNLFNGKSATKTGQGITWTVNESDNNIVTVSGTPTGFEPLTIDSNNVLPVGEYVLSGISDMVNVVYNGVFLYKGNTLVRDLQIQDNNAPRTFSILQSDDYDTIRVQLKRSNDGVACSGTGKNMITTPEEYKLSPTYEPYHESVEDWYWNNNAKTGVHNRVPYPFSTGKTLLLNGVTFTEDSGIVDVDTDGLTPTGNAFYYICQRLKSNKYAGMKMTGCPANGGNSSYQICCRVGKQSDDSLIREAIDNGEGCVVPSLDASTEQLTIYIRIASTCPILNHKQFNVLLRDASDTVTDFTPPAMTNRELTDAVTLKKLEETSTSEQVARITVPTSFHIAYVFVSLDSEKAFQCVVVKGISSRAFRFTYKASSNTEVRGYIWYDYTNSRIEVGSFMVNDVEMKNDTNIKLEVFYI